MMKVFQTLLSDSVIFNVFLVQIVNIYQVISFHFFFQKETITESNTTTKKKDKENNEEEEEDQRILVTLKYFRYLFLLNWNF